VNLVNYHWFAITSWQDQQNYRNNRK